MTHTAEVPYEGYQPEKIEKVRKKMKEQDLHELYGVSESGTELDLSSPFTDSRNITVDEMPNDGTCKEISDSEPVKKFLIVS